MKLKQILTVCAALYVALSVLMLSCQSDIEDAPSSLIKITSFKINGAEGSIDEETGKILVFIPYNAETPVDPAALTAEVQFLGASISPDPAQAQNYTDPLPYTVTAVDESTKVYTVTVELGTASSKDIVQFTLANQVAAITGTAITVTGPYNTNIKSITPAVQHTGSSYAPTGPQDFSSPVDYTVTAHDGSEKTYTVTVTLDASTENTLTSFQITGTDWTAIGTIDQTLKKITASVPHNEDGDVTFTPEIGHSGVSYEPTGPQDFTGSDTTPIEYTIRSAKGTFRSYSVTVTMAEGSECAITAFNIPGALSTTINEGANEEAAGTIAITVLYGTNLTSVTPEISHSGGASYTPQEPQDFRTSKDYTVTSQDEEHQKTYTVTVTTAPSHFKEITGFTINSIVGMVEETSDTQGIISLTVPHGTSIAALTPVITVSDGANLRLGGAAPSGPVNFTNPVTYTVQAANGTERQYVVTVHIAPRSAKQIIGFTIPDQTLPAVINQTERTITVEVPAYLNKQSLSPVITITGVSVDPASNTPTNLSSPQTYLVTAADDTTAEYTVTVVSAVVTPPITAETEGYIVTGEVDSGGLPNDLYNLFDHDVRGFGYETNARWVQLVWGSPILPQTINRVRLYSTNGFMAGAYVTFLTGDQHLPLTTGLNTTPAGTTVPDEAITGPIPEEMAAVMPGRFYYAAQNGDYGEIVLDPPITITGIKIEYVRRWGWAVFRPLQIYLDSVE